MMQIPTSDVLTLIRAHYEGNEDLFKEKCRQIADDLEKRSNDEGSVQLSHYIRGLIGDEPTWVPMDDEWVEVPPEK